MTDEEKGKLVKLCTENFFTHPNWENVIELINLYIEPLKSVENIDMSDKSNDEIATEVRARQITIEQLETFIRDSLTLKKISDDKGVPTTTRKYK